jgi:cysteine desulfurase/selenocysteine lyase
VVVDGAQAAPHLPLDLAGLGADFYAFSGHKMLGPTGVGVLYIKSEIAEEMPPFLGGGDMIETVEYDHFTTNELPYKFEAGTPNIAGVIGFGEAVRYLESLGRERIFEHERKLTEFALERLLSVDGLTLYGPKSPDRRGSVFAFNYKDVHAHDLATILDFSNIAVRAGHHCAQPLMKKLGVAATARASLYVYNNEEDIDLLLESLAGSERLLKNAVR